MVKSSNVRVLRKPRHEERYEDGFFMGYKEIEDPGPWLVIYNAVLQKWIITNNPTDHGLHADAAAIQPIGYGDTLNGALFVVYEHQKALGMERTVLDDIRAGETARSETARPDSSEWEWGKESKEFNPMLSELGAYNNKIIQAVMRRIEGDNWMT